ncbi:MAG TPA: GlsB/YeaQ/YmgE family stress response membrane protein, partial [Caulobacteraceae bacterium]
IIGAVVIGILAGWIAEQITGRRHGLLMNLIVGLVGAFVGGFLASVVGIDIEGFWMSLIASTVGAVLLLALFGLVRGRA